MRAVILAGRGSPETGSGGVLIRLAARARAAGIAPLVSACFLVHGRPSFTDVLEQSIARGAREIIIIPYAMALTDHDRATLGQLAESARLQHPHVTLTIAEPIGDHPALAHVLLQRALEADYTAAHDAHSPTHEPAWPIWHAHTAVSLLIVVDDLATLPVTVGEEAVRRCGGMARYATVRLCFLKEGEPRLDEAIDTLCAQGYRSVIIAPYSLERHMPFLPAVEAVIAAARARHPSMTIIQAEHLAYDRRLLDAIAERVAHSQKAG